MGGGKPVFSKLWPNFKKKGGRAQKKKRGGVARGVFGHWSHLGGGIGFFFLRVAVAFLPPFFLLAGGNFGRPKKNPPHFGRGDFLAF